MIATANLKRGDLLYYASVTKGEVFVHSCEVTAAGGTYITLRSSRYSRWQTLPARYCHTPDEALAFLDNQMPHNIAAAIEEAERAARWVETLKVDAHAVKVACHKRGLLP